MLRHKLWTYLFQIMIDPVDYKHVKLLESAKLHTLCSSLIPCTHSPPSHAFRAEMKWQKCANGLGSKVITREQNKNNSKIFFK